MTGNELEFKELNYSFIGKNTLLKGTSIFTGRTHLAGKVEGNLIVEDNSLLTLEMESLVVGEIEAGSVEIYGTIEGKVKARGKVTIYPTAVVSGELEAKELVIHSGSKVNIKGHTKS
jgi:cytoskeletal protein CcmA (bactofilin family)